MRLKRTIDNLRPMDSPDVKVPARGRKRFVYDLRHASETVAQGVDVQGLRLLSTSLVSVSIRIPILSPHTHKQQALRLEKRMGRLIVQLSMRMAISWRPSQSLCLVSHSRARDISPMLMNGSDASEYPSDHSFFCSSQDDLPSYVSRITEAIYEDGSLTIQDLLMRLLEKLAKRAATYRQAVKSAASDDEEDENDDDDEDDAEEYDIDEEIGMLGAQPGQSKLDRSILQRLVTRSHWLRFDSHLSSHFNETVAYGYYPGFIPFGVDDFALSVSIPANSLVDTIPARALMAWDKELLSRAQHVTLLISGLRGVYPFVQHDATYSQSAHFHGTAPQFRVGLTLGYKPSREDAAETIRKFGLKEDYDAQPAPDPVVPPLFGDDDLDYEDHAMDDVELENGEVEQPAAESVMGFRPFSLSSSLESLLNGHFLRILQLRIQFKLGWAGAETLLWEVETSQQAVGDIMRLRGQVCFLMRWSGLRLPLCTGDPRCRCRRRYALEQLQSPGRSSSCARPDRSESSLTGVLLPHAQDHGRTHSTHIAFFDDLRRCHSSALGIAWCAINN